MAEGKSGNSYRRAGASPSQECAASFGFVICWAMRLVSSRYQNTNSSHVYWFFFFLRNFLFCIAVYPINSVVIVSGEEQKDAATHIHVPILPQAPLPPRLPQDIEQRSMCHVGRGWLSILNAAVCSRWSRTVPSPHPSHPTLIIISLLSKSMSLFLFCK